MSAKLGNRPNAHDGSNRDQYPQQCAGWFCWPRRDGANLAASDSVSALQAELRVLGEFFATFWAEHIGVPSPAILAEQ